MNVAPARASAGQISGRTNLGLNGIQVLSDTFQSWIRKVEGESVGFVVLIFGTHTEGRNLPLLLQRAKSITLSLLPVSDINRIAQGFGLPGRKTGDVSRSEYAVSTQQTLSRD